MALLRYAKGVTIQENNIVQTVASAAGAISSIIFVLPGPVMVGWWNASPTSPASSSARWAASLRRDL